jgi:hypothetical protein
MQIIMMEANAFNNDRAQIVGADWQTRRAAQRGIALLFAWALLSTPAPYSHSL